MKTLTLSIAEAQVAIEEFEIAKIHNEVESLQSIVFDGIDSTHQLDKMQSLVSSSVNSDHFSDIAKESVRIAIESICVNLGSSSDKLFNVYSTESFNSPNYKEFALENLSSFVQELWIKVKDSLNGLWDKISKFWNDNFLALNKVKQSLEAVLQNVNENYKVKTSTLSKTKDDKLLTSFNNLKDVNDRTIEDFISTHENNFNKLNDIIKTTKNFNNHLKTIDSMNLLNNINDTLGSSCRDFTKAPFRFGDKTYPIITGEYVIMEYSFDDETADVTLQIDKEKLELKEDIDIYIINQYKLKQLIIKTIDVINNTIKYKQAQENVQKEFDNLIKVYDKFIIDNDFKSDNLVEHYDKLSLVNDPTVNSNYKKIIRLIYRINSTIPGLFSLIVFSNVKLARSIVHYSEYCLKEG